jgi:hypothetical protein
VGERDHLIRCAPLHHVLVLDRPDHSDRHRHDLDRGGVLVRHHVVLGGPVHRDLSASSVRRVVICRSAFVCRRIFVSPADVDHSDQSTTVKTSSSAAAISSVLTTQRTTGVLEGGVVTFLYQGGVAGACGTAHPHAAMIVAALRPACSSQGVSAKRSTQATARPRVQVTNVV